MLKIALLLLIDKSQSNTVVVGTCRTADTMNVIFAIMRYIIVNDQTNIINVNATCHDISSHKDIYPSGFEFIHHFLALRLFQVGVHFTDIQLHHFQCFRHFLYFQFRRREDYNPLRSLFCKETADNAQLLVFVANIGCLYYLVSRTGNRKFYAVRTSAIYARTAAGTTRSYALWKVPRTFPP